MAKVNKNNTEKYALWRRILGDLFPYFTKFAVVGISGIAVNQGSLAFLKEILGLRVTWAGIIAIEFSIISNFLLNNFWTWKDKKESPFWTRFVKYHMVTLLAGLLNYIILVTLTAWGLYYLYANLIGIAAGMVVNFFMNHFWTFRK